MAKIANQVILNGRNMVHDALLSDMVIKKIIVSKGEDKDSRIIEIKNIARDKGIEIEEKWADELSKMCESESHQGVVAVMDSPEMISLEQILREKRDAFVLLLNHIDYEQNLGAILRTAWAAGVDAVVASPNGVSELTPVVAKVSMGAAAYVPLISMSMFAAINMLNKYAVPVVGVEVDKGEDYSSTILTGPVAFLMGGEAVGITEQLQKKCDILVNIPMVTGVASLNVSVATGLILFEKTRQERLRNK